MTEGNRNKPFVCACAEGKERSVHAVEILKDKGFVAKLLPGGLEHLQEYLLGDDHDITAAMERTILRDKDAKISDIRKDYNSTYNRLIRINGAVWLVFIGGNVELGKFKKVIDELKTKFGIEVVVLESYNRDSVEEKIKSYLIGKN